MEETKPVMMTLYESILKEGMEKGMEKMARRVICSGYSSGLSIQQLSEQTGYGEDVVRQILKKENTLD